MPHLPESREIRECIQSCLECGDACTRTAAHCLKMGGEHASPEHQTILQDCADACFTAARFMGRGSHLHARTCGVCAEACETCADDCDRLADGDKPMQECARICRRCAESCRQMAGAGV